MSLAVCARLESGGPRAEEGEAATTRTQRRLHQLLLHMEEHERRHRALVESMQVDKECRMDVSLVVAVLQRVTTSSARELRAPVRTTKDKGDAALEEEQVIEHEEMTTLLASRWARANSRVLRVRRLRWFGHVERRD